MNRNYVDSPNGPCWAPTERDKRDRPEKGSSAEWRDHTIGVSEMGIAIYACVAESKPELSGPLVPVLLHPESKTVAAVRHSVFLTGVEI